MNRRFPYPHFAVKQTAFQKDPQAWYACGICSLYTCLALLGMRDRTLRNIQMQFEKIRPYKLIESDGVSTQDLESVTKDLGYQFHYFERFSSKKRVWDYLIESSNQGNAVLLFPPSHCVVLWGANKSGAWIMDPDDLEMAFQYQNPDAIFESWDIQGSGIYQYAVICTSDLR